MWRQCFSVPFLKCGERLFASFSTRIHHVRSGNWGWSRQPCAGNLATREPQVSAARLRQALLCMHSLNYCVCTPNLNLQAPCTSSAKTISALLRCRHQRFQQL